MQNRMSMRDGGDFFKLEQLTRRNALKDIYGGDIDG